jgi:O-antigen/teichoic acid export membrane protein
MLSPVALGLYVVAQAFTSLPRLIGQSVGMIVYPVIAAEQDRSNNMEKVWRVFWVVCGINAPVTIVLIVLMPVLVPLFFGPEFESSVVLAQILLVGALLYSVRRPLVEGGRGLGFPGISTCAELSVYPWLLISAFLIIPYFGVTGLAVTVSVAFGFALLVAVMLVLKIRFDNRV